MGDLWDGMRRAVASNLLPSLGTGMSPSLLHHSLRGPNPRAAVPSMSHRRKRPNGPSHRQRTVDEGRDLLVRSCGPSSRRLRPGRSTCMTVRLWLSRIAAAVPVEACSAGDPSGQPNTTTVAVFETSSCRVILCSPLEFVQGTRRESHGGPSKRRTLPCFHPFTGRLPSSVSGVVSGCESR